jgi:hypothetical protein
MAEVRPVYPFRHLPPDGLLRLRLAPRFGRALADGVWWPYGRDLQREGPHLADEFPPARGRVDRLAYSPVDWDESPDSIYSRFGRIKVGLLPDEFAGFVLLRLTHVPQPTVARIRLIDELTPWQARRQGL